MQKQTDQTLKVTVFWGDIFYDTVLCPPKGKITLGNGPQNTFMLETGGSEESFPLVQVLPGKVAEILFNDHIDGHLRIQDQIVPLRTAKEKGLVEVHSPGNYKVKIGAKDKADLVIGHVSFYLDWLRNPEKVKHSLGRDGKWLAMLALVALSFSGLIVWWAGKIEIVEPPKPPERVVRLEPRSRPLPQLKAKAAAGTDAVAGGGSAKGELGKAAVAPKPSPVEKLRKMGLNNLVSGLSNLTANLSLNPAAARKDNPVIEGAVPQKGSGGFSTEGLKTGGGGKSMGIGRTVGQGQGGFEGTGKLGLSGNSLVESGSAHGQQELPIAKGGLDKDIIDSIVRRNQQRIQNCYERQLNFYPNLAGKITVQFNIGSAGKVVGAKIVEDTMRNDLVKKCLLDEVKEWVFPPPTGGTQVNVDYPFVFESSNR